MPFVRGRYYLNPVAGSAVEAARAAEDALGGGAGDDSGDAAAADRAELKEPVSRIEIEATEIVPSHTGRAARGFVARVHRGGNSGGTVGSLAPKPETHVFGDHRDLVDFLSGELG